LGSTVGVGVNVGVGVSEGVGVDVTVDVGGMDVLVTGAGEQEPISRVIMIMRARK